MKTTFAVVGKVFCNLSETMHRWGGICSFLRSVVCKIASMTLVGKLPVEWFFFKPLLKGYLQLSGIIVKQSILFLFIWTSTYPWKPLIPSFKYSSRLCHKNYLFFFVQLGPWRTEELHMNMVVKGNKMSFDVWLISL